MTTFTRYLCLSYSRYAQRLVQANPDLELILAQALHKPWSEERLLMLAQQLCQRFGVFSGLRRLRAQVLLSLMERDLQQLADVQEVMQGMTWLAEVSIQQASAALYQQLCERYGVPRGKESGAIQQLWVVGMGKLGGRELNVSSDIDLVYLYQEDGMTDGGAQHSAISNHEFFDHLARKLTYTLSEIDQDGFVFRVDLRLRPNGSAGFLACSLAMLQSYFAMQARDWERFAWIKARLLVGSNDMRQCQDSFNQIVQEFVYRPYIDFNVLAAIKDIRNKIDVFTIREQRIDSIDIKLYPGGIRDIEFTVQAWQLIYGGKDRTLRDQSTLNTLSSLCRKELIARDIADNLQTAYLFLRRLEHRLQYLDDAQTHSLPKQQTDQQQLANSMEFAHVQALFDRLEQVRIEVKRYFHQLLFETFDLNTKLSLWDQAMLPIAGELTEKTDSTNLLALLRYAQTSLPYKDLDHVHKRHVDTLMRCALDFASQKIEQPEKFHLTMVRMLDLINAISSRKVYLTLLIEHPQALAHVIDIVSTSQWAATYLTQYPDLLSELAQSVGPELDNYAKSVIEKVRARLLQAYPNVDEQMNILRHTQRSRTFQILLRDLQGLLSVERVADYLSELADMLLTLTLEAVWSQMSERHCDSPKFAIAAYGKLGGKELGYASDLDLVFLYDDPYEGAQEIYTNLARKLIAWLTTYTSSGVLYDVDLRLRPNGDAGLLVTDFAAFERYQLGEAENSAWVWEHQALARARFCAGDREIGTGFERVRTQVLCQSRDPEKLRQEVLAMRDRIVKAHPITNTEFDIKHSRGGVVDIEFIVQYLVLLYSKDYPQLLANVGNITLLYFAAEVALLDSKVARKIAHAYRTLRMLQHQHRLNGIYHPRISTDEIPAECQVVIGLWETIFG